MLFKTTGVVEFVPVTSVTVWDIRLLSNLYQFLNMARPISHEGSHPNTHHPSLEWQVVSFHKMVTRQEALTGFSSFVPEEVPPAQWSSTLASKGNLHHTLDFRAVSNHQMAPIWGWFGGET